MINDNEKESEVNRSVQVQMWGPDSDPTSMGHWYVMENLRKIISGEDWSAHIHYNRKACQNIITVNEQSMNKANKDCRRTKWVVAIGIILLTLFNILDLYYVINP